MNDTCPKCGADYYYDDYFKCGSKKTFGPFVMGLRQSEKCRIAELQSALDAAQDAFRELACYGQAGGYNQDQFDLPTFVDKIRFLIDEGAKKTLALDAANKRIAELENSLKIIERWHGEFPPSGRFWDDEQMRPMSYGSAFGSNGERDYMRNIARAALKGTP